MLPKVIETLFMTVTEHQISELQAVSTSYVGEEDTQQNHHKPQHMAKTIALLCSEHANKAYGNVNITSDVLETTHVCGTWISYTKEAIAVT